MKLNWFVPLAFLLSLHLYADNPVRARVATIAINPGEVTPIHLRPDFESTIRMPEEVTSVIVGSPGSFKVEHNEGEPEYVYVKPVTKLAAQSNLLIATKSGQHVTLELISEGAGVAGNDQPVDFLIEYCASRSFFIASNSPPPSSMNAAKENVAKVPADLPTGSLLSSALDEEFQLQARLNAPSWTKWDGKQIQTSLGDIRQWKNEMVISYSIFNGSDQPVEIVPPQIQVTGLKPAKKKKAGKGIISDQLEIRDFKLSTTRIEPGGRADGVVEFDRPNFKQSTEKLFLQIAQADQVDKPILIHLPFTPPISNNYR